MSAATIGFRVDESVKRRLEETAARQHRPLSDLVHELLVVPESKPLADLLEQLLAGRDVIAQVIDEHGGFAGLVTMDDVVESFLGLEIVDESDSVEDMRALAKQRWRARARRLGLLTDDEK